MNGMIAKGMGSAPPAAQQPQDQAMPVDEDDSGVDESNPVFKQAWQFAHSALYDKGAALNVAEQLRRSTNVAEGIANTAFEIVAITDERTNGEIPDELLIPFATKIVNEIVEIAKEAGVQVANSDIGEAIKMMIIRWLGENGHDTTEMQEAFDKFDTGSLNSIDDEQQPGQPAMPPAQQPTGAQPA